MKRTRAIYWLGALLLSTTVNAQDRVNHRDYPVGYFDKVNNGDPVDERYGYEWRHDGISWMQVCTNPYACEPGPQPSVPPSYQVPNYVPGKHYIHAYPSMRIFVIAVTLDGPNTVVTARITSWGLPERVGEYVTFKAGSEPYFEDVNGVALVKAAR